MSGICPASMWLPNILSSPIVVPVPNTSNKEAIRLMSKAVIHNIVTLFVIPNVIVNGVHNAKL